MDIYFADESGFSLQPNVSYTWQPIGEQWGIPAIDKKRINVLGFLNPITEHLVTYQLPEKAYMNSKLFIHYLNDFSEKINKPTAVVIDRAPWHTSALTISMIETWEEKGLFLLYLPAYCPHYNLIETLWRKIKHEWLAIKDFVSIRTLKKKLNDIFLEFANKYTIKFSMNVFNE